MISLRGITWDHPRGYDPLVAAAAAYRAVRPDVEVAWERRSGQAFADQPVDQLAAAFDLVVLDHPHIGHAAASRCLLPLDGAGRDGALAAIRAAGVGASYESYAWGGRQWALPLDAASHACAWPAEAPPPGGPPRGWAEAVSLARGGGVLWPANPVNAMMSFLTLMAGAGAPCGRSGRFAEPAAARRALAAMRAMAEAVPRFCLDEDPVSTLDRMGRDDWRYCPLVFCYLPYSRRGFRPRRLRFGPAPTLGGTTPGGAVLGGTGVAVSAGCAEPEAAADHAVWLCGAEVQRGVYLSANGQPAHGAAWDDPACDARAGGFFADAGPAVRASWLRPRHDGFMAVQDGGGAALHTFLARREPDAEEALAALERLWTRSRPPPATLAGPAEGF